MRVAALYDVHAMPWALDAVLAVLDADAIVIGGDFLYGPYPGETLRRVRALDAVVLRGNCEETPIEFERGVPSHEELEWAAGLPLAVELDGVVYCHATPSDNLPSTTAITPDAVVKEIFAGVTGAVVIGHTHHQFDRRIGDLRVVNAGSIGMPYEGVGPTGNATLRVNPVAMMATGFLRKIFEVRSADDSKAVPPYSSPSR